MIPPSNQGQEMLLLILKTHTSIAAPTFSCE